jgi:hypothetical protein
LSEVILSATSKSLPAVTLAGPSQRSCAGRPAARRDLLRAAAGARRRRHHRNLQRRGDGERLALVERRVDERHGVGLDRLDAVAAFEHVAFAYEEDAVVSGRGTTRGGPSCTTWPATRYGIGGATGAGGGGAASTAALCFGAARTGGAFDPEQLAARPREARRAKAGLASPRWRAARSSGQPRPAAERLPAARPVCEKPHARGCRRGQRPPQYFILSSHRSEA